MRRRSASISHGCAYSREHLYILFTILTLIVFVPSAGGKPCAYPSAAATYSPTEPTPWAHTNNAEMVSECIERQPPESPDEPPDAKLLVYYGKFADEKFLDIIKLRPIRYRSSYIGVAGINYPLVSLIGPIGLEAEWHVAQHRGLQTHLETNGLLIARLGDETWPVSIAYGGGLSLASETPRLETEDEESNPLLYYMMVEIDFGLPYSLNRLRMLLRVHHRSGAFGTFCPKICGSNFITFGVKIPLYFE